MFDLLKGAPLNWLLKPWRRRRALRVLQHAQFYMSAQAPHAIPLNDDSNQHNRLLWIGGGALLRPVAGRLGAQSFVSFFLKREDLTSLSVPCKLEDLAALMVARMMELQPQGPYFAGGWCQEGLLAYEVAQQLQKRGCETGLLVLADVPTPESEKLSLAEKLMRRAELEAFHLSVISRLPLSQWREYLAGRLEWFMVELKRRRSAYHETNDDKRAPQAFDEFLYLSAGNYKPLPYSGRVLFLQPQQRPAGERWNAAAGWKDLVNRLEVFEIPGDHTTMFRNPMFADHIRKALDQAEGR